MFLTPEVQLMAVAVGLYVLDSCVLLHGNEGVLVRRGEHRWALSLGLAHARIGGKHLFVPNLLAVHQPVLRMAWQFDKAGSPPDGWADPGPTLRALGYASLWLGLVLFGLFPAVLFLYLRDSSLVAVLVLLYLSIGTSLYLVHRHRQAYGLGRRQFWALCFECLVCPPLAVNLVRRLSLNLCERRDLVTLSFSLLEGDERASAQAAFASRLEDQLVLLDEQSVQGQAVQGRLVELTQLFGATRELG